MKYKFEVEFDRNKLDHLDSILKAVDDLYGGNNFGYRVINGGNILKIEIKRFSDDDGLYPLYITTEMIKFKIKSLPTALRSQEDVVWKDATTHQTITVSVNGNGNGIIIKPTYKLLGK